MDEFAGVQMHSHDYKGEDPAFFRDKRVVVLGMGKLRERRRGRRRADRMSGRTAPALD